MNVVSWGQFAEADGQLAAYAESRLATAICYFATMRSDGWPRVHPIGPVTPIDGRVLVAMLPTSPKARDLERDGRYAVHCTVEDSNGGGGEVLLTGLASHAEPTEHFRSRGWIAFELLVGELRSTRFNPDLGRPESTVWRPT